MFDPHWGTNNSRRSVPQLLSEIELVSEDGTSRVAGHLPERDQSARHLAPGRLRAERCGRPLRLLRILACDLQQSHVLGPGDLDGGELSL